MANDIAKEVTERIVAQLKAGTCPWKQPWTGTGSGLMPRNAVTGRAYSGVNVLLLWSTAAERGYTSPGWLTFKQALDAGGHVRKGEKGTRVVFVSTCEKKDKATGEHGLSLDTDVVVTAKHDESRDDDSEAFIASTGAVIAHGEGRAYYRPSTDSIMLPGFETFTGAGAYYATCFHELGHWTGAESRLARTFGKRFGDDAYAAEELVAELTSAFILAELGFAPTGMDAAYLAHWIKFLTDHETAIMTAASAASKALAYLRGLAVAEETNDEAVAA